MLVTAKKYYLDKALVSVCDHLIALQRQKHDVVILMDGDEGSGKSTFSWSIGAYLCEQLGKPFSVDNIYFDPDEIIKYASTTTENLIIWDEAALGGLGRDWHNKIQSKLIKMLMTARKKRHVYIFIVPKFFELNKYIAAYRSRILINTHLGKKNGSNYARGFFSLFDKMKKDDLYSQYMSKRRLTQRDYYNYRSLRGTFANHTHLLDVDAYENKKDEAIEKYFSDEETLSGYKKRYVELGAKIAYNSGFTMKELSQKLDIPESTLYDWRKKGEIMHNA